MIRINKWLDLIDRAGWTFVQAALGSFIVLGWDDWKLALSIAGTATAGSIVKVMAAQRVGDNELGAAVPGEVIETTLLTRPEAVR